MESNVCIGVYTLDFIKIINYILFYIIYRTPYVFYKTDRNITIQSEKKKILYLVQYYDLQSSLNRGVNNAIFIR